MKLSLGKTNFRQVCTMLKFIYRTPGINRKQLGEVLCIDRAMVTHIYNYLVEQGWLIEQESALKRLPLVLNTQRLYVAGVEIQPEFQIIIVTDISGKIVFEKYLKDKVQDPVKFLTDIVVPELRNCGYKISAVGVGIPGIVLSSEKKILRSVPFGLTSEISFPSEVCITENPDASEEALLGDGPVPVFVENDVRCWGWGKVAFEKDFSSFIVFLQHFIDDPEDSSKFCRITGGSTLFMNAKPLTGAHGCAGEMPGIFRVEDYKANHVPEVIRNSMKTDRASMEKYLKNMALTISLFSNTLDVNKVFISGLENMDVEFLKEKIRKYVSEYRFYPDLQDLDVQFCPSDYKTTALGACGYVLEELIVAPCETEALDSKLFSKRKV